MSLLAMRLLWHLSAPITDRSRGNAMMVDNQAVDFHLAVYQSEYTKNKVTFFNANFLLLCDGAFYSMHFPFQGHELPEFLISNLQTRSGASQCLVGQSILVQGFNAIQFWSHVPIFQQAWAWKRSASFNRCG
jgi:hypothetical protein